MSRINTNVDALLSQRMYANNTRNLSKSLERLSTGFRINRGADDPAGLIASENLRSQQTAISAAISNAERADQVMNVAEGGLQEVNALLLELQGLVGSAGNEAGLSAEEKQANQLQVDSILQTIDRIAESTSFQGVKLLNGSLDFDITGQSANIVDAEVRAAKLDHGESRAVQVLVTDSAQHAGLFMSMGGTSLDLTSAVSKFTFEVAGKEGSRQFSFTSGTALSAIAAQVNTYKDVTGVSATVSNSGLMVKSTEYGSDQFVSIAVSDDGGHSGSIVQLSAGNENVLSTTSTALNAASAGVKDTGQDIDAIVNGLTATASGKTVRLNTEFLDVEMTMSNTASQALGSTTAFTITGGGAEFNIGPTVNVSNQVILGIGNMASRNLGSAQAGKLNSLGAGMANNTVDGDITQGQRIVDAAIKQVSELRGRIGAFQKNVLGATINSLGVAYENTAAAESMIRDTDFAAETAEMTRSQILVAASSNVLAITKAMPQNVLGLLG